jgi:hypothetical protein
MATIMDLGLLNYFTPIIVFIFVFILLWAMMKKLNFFPGNDGAHLLIALTLSILFILVPELTDVVSLATPWFIILLIFLFMIVLIFLFMGAKPEAVAGLFGGVGTPNQTILWTIIIVSLAIMGYAFTQVYGEQIHNLTAGESTDESGDLMMNIGQIVFTPKVLGMFFLLLMSALIIKFITMPAT